MSINNSTSDLPDRTRKVESSAAATTGPSCNDPGSGGCGGNREGRSANCTDKKDPEAGNNGSAGAAAPGSGGPDQQQQANVGPKLCRRCKTDEGTISMRGQPTCANCFVPFIKLKAVKRLNTLHRALADMRGSRAPHKTTYLSGLSLGPGSAVLLALLHDNIEYLVRNGRAGIAYAVTVLHVDTALDDAPRRAAADALLARYAARFPRLRFERAQLERVVDLPGVKWAALGVQSLPEADVDADAGGESGLAKARRLRAALDGLHSVSARVDVLHTLVRHVLLAHAAAGGYDAVLLGSSMTTLAERAFSEVAKGRGAAVPWLTQDGVFPLPADDGAQGGGSGSGDGGAVTRRELPVYHVLRDVFRGEVVTFSGLAEAAGGEALTSLIPSLAEQQQQIAAKKTIVSHKTLSIEEVMARFFDDAEATGQASVISNVVRTTDRLARHGGGGGACGCEICGLPMDVEGDERWRGEIGAQEEEEERQGLCHGCQRALTM
ncbi:hypothetical protein BROUX41_003853 [Berkeleyomyces rouxiae]|uniref:uncharacterized protein n=1 Tax=Berkeleyomyces rouxiae TaxID=2035830 RepID=UPI003B80BF0D